MVQDQPFFLKVRKGISHPKREAINVSPKDFIFLMGICGTAMSSLALFLKKKGFKVSGSDKNIYPPVSTLLKSYNIPIKPYCRSNISQEIRLVILGNVIKKINPEVSVLEELKIPYMSLPDFLEQTILNRKKNIVVCGTHGKSTITSMIACAGQALKPSPGYFVGGISQNFNSSFSTTISDWFVIEGDEYDTAFFAKYPKFFHYNPFALILSHLEFDHLDIYKNMDDILSVFFKLIQKVPKEGVIIVNSDNQWLKQIKEYSKASIITYGLKQGDYTLSSFKFCNEKSKFKIKHKDELYDCSLSVYGFHNALNALSVFALSHHLKWPLERVLKNLSNFKGIKRRLQKRGEVNDVILFEDFAHHPTSVKITLKSLKEIYPERRLFAVFEPRSFTSRTSLFQKEYSFSFQFADFIFIFPPFNADSIPKENRFSSQMLMQDLRDAGKRAFVVQNQEQFIQNIQNLIKPQDVIVLMSNGHLEEKIQALLKLLKTC